MRPQTLHRVTLGLIHGVMLVGLALTLWQQQWLTAFVTAGIIGFTLLPGLLSQRFKVFIPPEIELLAIALIFGSLFLGEVRDYYVRFWWWDAALHTGSGFLLGILGFLLVHVMNQAEEIDLHMNPAFVALFSFMFALGVGALWEVFEYGMDVNLGMNMQKSGLRDTMWDLIVDAVGALVVSASGYFYLRSGRQSLVFTWIDAFVEGNPRLFGKD